MGRGKYMCGGATIAKHVVIHEQKNKGKGMFFTLTALTCGLQWGHKIR